MSVQNPMDGDPKKNCVRVARCEWVAIPLAVLMLLIVFVAGVAWFPDFTSAPSVGRQSQEVAALETHVLPVVKDLRATWYLNEPFGSGMLYWKRGDFAKDPARARRDGDRVFDEETEASFRRFSRSIRASGVPATRLRDARFADDGSLRAAYFQRRGGGLEFVFTYIYSPGAEPERWTSNLGPVVLTRIGESDWWFEQSPDD